jgi:hypothetical protein
MAGKTAGMNKGQVQLATHLGQVAFGGGEGGWRLEFPIGQQLQLITLAPHPQLTLQGAVVGSQVVVG